MSRPRINSANRTSSAEHDIRVLRGTITKLEEELLQSRATTQKVTDQLNCLMVLVKRAWTGDQTAAVNVANIVGVAPPDLEETTLGDLTTLAAKPKTEEEFEPLKVFMRNKSRALNNWAVLTIGILNREYSHLEKQQEARARHYLQQRKAYLEEQLLQHRDAQFREAVAFQQQEEEHMTYLKESIMQQQQQTIQIQPLRRVNSLTDVGRNRQRTASFTEEVAVGGKTFLTQPGQKSGDSRPASCKTRAPPGRHLYRPAGQKQEPLDLTWADLVVEPGHQTNEQSNGYYSNHDVIEPSRQGHRQRKMSYDDPRRYNVSGLYDTENALGPGSSVFRKRPPSAKQQRQSDDMRARPRSAVYAKNERPLKYETTRPVSAIVKNSNSRQNRPPSGKKQQRKSPNKPAQKHFNDGGIQPQNGLINNQTSVEENLNNISLEDSYEDINDLVYDEAAFEKLGIDLKEVEREVRLAKGIKVDIKKPKSVIQFEEDVRNMHDMERTIRKTTMDLQKKLGIGEQGIVY